MKVFDKIYEAIGWTHADDCVDTDKGYDVRQKDIANMVQRAIEDLELTELEKEANNIDRKLAIYESYYNDLAMLLKSIQGEAIHTEHRLNSADDREVEMQQAGRLEAIKLIKKELEPIVNSMRKDLYNCEEKANEY